MNRKGFQVFHLLALTGQTFRTLVRFRFHQSDPEQPIWDPDPSSSRRLSNDVTLLDTTMFVFYNSLSQKVCPYGHVATLLNISTNASHILYLPFFFCYVTNH
jgi:hypothetical protein